MRRPLHPLPQPLEISRVELPQVELRLAVPRQPWPGAQERQRVEAEIIASSVPFVVSFQGLS